MHARKYLQNVPCVTMGLCDVGTVCAVQITLGFEVQCERL